MMKRPCCAGSSVTLVMTDTAHVTVFIEPVFVWCVFCVV